MAKKIYDILVDKAKQVIPVYVDLDTDDKTGKLAKYGNVQVLSKSQALALSHLGTPIVSPFTFKAGNYFKWRETELELEQQDELRLPLDTSISVSQAKNVVITNMQGGIGSVKEITGMNDADITIEGTILYEPGHPNGADQQMDMMARINKWNRVADAVDVSCDLLVALDIFKLLIQSVDFKPKRGSEDIIFSIKAVSDEFNEIISGI